MKTFTKLSKLLIKATFILLFIAFAINVNATNNNEQDEPAQVNYNIDNDATNILLKFLDNKAEQAMKEIEEKGSLSEENAIPLILKTQFNHIAHLDKELSLFREMVDKRFEKMDLKFEKMDEKFDKMDEKFDRKFARIYALLGIGFSIIAALIVILKFVK